MCLRAEEGATIADKTALKMMREMGLCCGIRRETDYHRYNSFRGVVGETFENLVARDFSAEGPWQKMGADVTEFKCSFGKVYLAPVYDFGSKEIVAWSVSRSPVAPQLEPADLLGEPIAAPLQVGHLPGRRRAGPLLPGHPAGHPLANELSLPCVEVTPAGAFRHPGYPSSPLVNELHFPCAR